MYAWDCGGLAVVAIAHHAHAMMSAKSTVGTAGPSVGAAAHEDTLQFGQINTLLLGPFLERGSVLLHFGLAFGRRHICKSTLVCLSSCPHLFNLGFDSRFLLGRYGAVINKRLQSLFCLGLMFGLMRGAVFIENLLDVARV